MSMNQRGETEFMVDRHKHRIVKRDGLWKLYCPRRGTGPNSLILSDTFDRILAAYSGEPCLVVEVRYGYFIYYSHGLILPS